MSDNPVNFERYICVIVDKPLKKEAIASWMRAVKKMAPSGLVSVIQTTTDKGVPRSVSMIHRETQKDHRYMIPLVRDLSDSEIEKIVEKFSADNPDIDFDISTNQMAFKPKEREALTLDQEQHLALCMAMAKQKHEDWVRERTDAGWRYGTTFNVGEKTHPLLRPWDQLPDKFRKPDLDWPQKLISMLNSQGYSVIKADELKNLMSMLRDIV